jgi:hypothetical protein
MSIILLSTTESLQVALDATPATNQLPCVPSWADIGGAAGGTPILTNGSTPVTAVPSPASGVARVLNSLSIPNRDTASRIVTVNKVVSAVSYQIIRINLPAGFQLYYENNGGWRVLDASGNFIEAVQAIQSGTWTVNQGGAPWSQNLTQVSGSSISLGQKASSASFPVVLASDQSSLSTVGLGTSYGSAVLTNTTAVMVGGASFTKVVGIQGVSVGATLAAGSTTAQLIDGGGTVRANIACPTSVSTPMSPFMFFNFYPLNFQLVNGGNPVSLKLSTALSSGSIVISVLFA